MVSAATFEWRLLSLPYVVASAICLTAVIAAGLIRGDRVVRVGLIGTAAAVTPWTLGTAAAICAVDRETAARLYQLANGPTTMLGPSLLLILLSVSGQLERYRWHARAAIASGVVFALVTWSTNLIIDGATKIPSGIWYARAGVLMWLHAAQIVGWPIMGLVIALRAWPARQRTSMLRYLAALPAMTMIGTADTLLAYGIGGVYPLAWLPALGGGVICLHLMFRTELLRSRGVERTALVELIGTAVATVAIGAVLWTVTEGMPVEPAVVALISAPLWGVALLMSWLAPRTSPPAAAIYEHLLEELAHASSSGGPVSERLAVLWGQYAALPVVRLRLDVEAFEPELRGWLRSLDAPVMSAEVATMRLGQRRAAIEAMFAASGAAVVVPVIDRGELIAVVEAEQATPRTLLDAERVFLFDSAQLVGHALTYDRLARDAQAAVTSAREVELANVLAAHYRPLQDERGPWRLAVEHRASAHPGGVGWSWAQLEGGKVAVMIAEAEPQGVAGALVIAALQGAFVARSREAGCGPSELLESLRDTVASIGRRTLVLVLDAQARTLQWASAGHRGAAVASDTGVTLLSELGDADAGTAPLPEGALVMLLSSSVQAAPGVVAALAGGVTGGLRRVTQLVELAAEDAAMAAGAGGAEAATPRDLLAIGMAERK